MLLYLLHAKLTGNLRHPNSSIISATNWFQLVDLKICCICFSLHFLFILLVAVKKVPPKNISEYVQKISQLKKHQDKKTNKIIIAAKKWRNRKRQERQYNGTKWNKV